VKYKDKDKEFRKRGCKEKHDRIGDIVSEEFDGRGWRVRQNVEYDDEHFNGEIDVYACKPGYLALTEVKSNHSESNFYKALDQLARATVHCDLYKPQDKIFTFYASTDCRSNDMRLMRVPRLELPTKYHLQLPVEDRELVEAF